MPDGPPLLSQESYLANPHEPAAGKILENIDRDAHAGMNAVVHVIPIIHIHNVNVIVVAPIAWPRIDEPERVAAILETPAIVLAPIDVEPVLAAKIGGVMVVRNTAMRVIALVSTVALWLLRGRRIPPIVTLLRAIYRMCLRLL